jgi:Flp pilus assembly protein TadB
MSIPSLTAAACVAVAVALASRPAPSRERWRWGLVASPERAAAPAEARDDMLGRHRVALALLAAMAPVVLLGGHLGMAGAVGAGVLTWRALGNRETAAARRRRERVARDLPHVVDLLAVTLASGASPAHALSLVAAAAAGPVVDDLRAAERSLALGRDPARVWRELGRRPGLAALGRAMVRAVETGALVSDALHRLAEDLHSSARLEAESRARAVGVRAAAPLGLCLLPAFILVGVVPLVASTALALLAG